MDRAVTKIEKKKAPAVPLTRVAAYSRVSTGKDAMLHSLTAQISYYSDYIQRHPGWLFCGVFSDEATTGTKENRAGFQALLRECRTGNIDLVITKSISRFARNTVILLETVRELKELGIDVYFEEQNIHTISPGPIYWVNNAHEPIISMETFEAVQEEIRRRGKKYRPDTRERKSYPLSGLIVCGCCGDRYRRKTTRTGPIWICKTYNTQGKDKCPSKAIPEPALEELVSDIALDDLTALRAEPGNRLVFCHKDGSESVKQWEDRSRAESWTPEMKAAASMRTKQIREAKRNGNN
jgi:DNA invertase Pin-like site-specific DNA recombinase